MKLKRSGDPREFEIEIISRDGGIIRVRIDGEEIVGKFSPNAGGGGILEIGASRYRVFAARRKESIAVSVGPASFEFKSSEDSSRRRVGGLAAPEITAPMPGKVLSVLVQDGDMVAAGEPLIVIEAMKMETTLSAESAAVVKHVRVATGQTVDHGTVLIELSPPPAASAPKSEPRDP